MEASYDSTVLVTMVQVVSPLVKYSLLVSTTRVTLQLVNVMQHTLNKHSEIKKNFFIALDDFSVLPRRKWLATTVKLCFTKVAALLSLKGTIWRLPPLPEILDFRGPRLKNLFIFFSEDVALEGSILLLSSEGDCIGCFLLGSEGFDGSSRLAEFCLASKFCSRKGLSAFVAQFAGVEGLAFLGEIDVGVLADLTVVLLYHLHWNVLCHVVCGYPRTCVKTPF